MAYLKEDKFVPGAWNAICDRCGRKRKSTELRRTWQGYYVCEAHFEERHPQDFVRARVERDLPEWTRPPMGQEPALPPPPAIAPTAFFEATTGSLTTPQYRAATPIGFGFDNPAYYGTLFYETLEVLAGTMVEWREVFGVNGDPYTFENDAAHPVPFPPDKTYVDASSGVTVTISGFLENGLPSAAGTIEYIPATVDTNDSGRFSMLWVDVGPNSTPIWRSWGEKFLKVGTNGFRLVFSFSEPVAAFGVGLIDWMDFGGTTTWRTFRNGVELSSKVVGPYYEEGVNEDPSGQSGWDSGAPTFVGVGRADKPSANGVFDKIELQFNYTGVDYTAVDTIFVATLKQQTYAAFNGGVPIQFTDRSDGTPTAWLWDFGDGTTSTLQNPVKTFAMPDFQVLRTVTLTVTNDAGTSTASKLLAIRAAWF